MNGIKKVSALLLTMFLLLTSASCSDKNHDNVSDTSAVSGSSTANTVDSTDLTTVVNKTEKASTAPAVLEYTDCNYSDSFADDEQTLLNFSVSYPKFSYGNDDEFTAYINGIYTALLKKEKKEAKELFAQAKEYKESRLDEADDPENVTIFAYESTITHSVTYCGDHVACVLTDEYGFWGGAHGSSTRSGRIFDFKAKKELTPTEILGLSKSELKQKVLDAFKDMIDTNEYQGILIYDDAVKNYDDIEYYYKDGQLFFFYQVYTIGPYIAGFPEVGFKVAL